jgi:hypothetical protein
MWSDGGPIDPSPTVDQAINRGYLWLEIECSRGHATRDVDLAALRRVGTTCVHDLASGSSVRSARPPGSARLRQLEPAPRHSAQWFLYGMWRQ